MTNQSKDPTMTVCPTCNRHIGNDDEFATRHNCGCERTQP